MFANETQVTEYARASLAGQGATWAQWWAAHAHWSAAERIAALRASKPTPGSRGVLVWRAAIARVEEKLKKRAEARARLESDELRESGRRKDALAALAAGKSRPEILRAWRSKSPLVPFPSSHLAIALAKAYHWHVRPLYSSKHATVAYGAAEAVAEYGIYSRRWHSSHGPAKWSNAGAHWLRRGDRFELRLETSRGTIIRLATPWRYPGETKQLGRARDAELSFSRLPGGGMRVKHGKVVIDLKKKGSK